MKRQRFVTALFLLGLSYSLPCISDDSIRYPPYNDIHFKATHNSYWVDVFHSSTDPDYDASGVQQRLIDQLLHEHVRSLELDLHFEGGHPGEFTVYHTARANENSTCHYLTDCLQILQRLDYLLPDHEPVLLVLEAKEVSLAFTGRIFGTDHHMEDLDRQLWEHLGPRIFTPREFLSRCTPGVTLLQCAQERGWPTTDELRGRYIVGLIGNFANNYWDWLEYATLDGGVASRAAFPMRSVLGDDKGKPDCDAFVNPPLQARCRAQSWPDESGVEINGATLLALGRPNVWDHLDDPDPGQRAAFLTQHRTAIDNSIIWQVETSNREGVPNVKAFLESGHGLARSHDAFKKKPEQEARIKDGIQGVQTDYPWFFITDDTLTPPSPLLPTDSSRAVFEAAEVLGPPRTRKFTDAALTEPGDRLYTRGPFVRALLNKPPFSDNRATDTWETQPSTTRRSTTDPQFPLVANAGGAGLIALSDDDTSSIEVHREVTAYRNQMVQIVVVITVSGVRTVQVFDVPHQEPKPEDVGDLLRMDVKRLPTSNETQVMVFTAGTMGPDGQPIWNPLKLTPSGDPVEFKQLLNWQGLSSDLDTLFVGTKRNGKLLGKSDFTKIVALESGVFNPNPARLIDLSWCLDSSCRGTKTLPAHEQRFPSAIGDFVAVHEAFGGVFGNQARHLYTTDLFESQTSGLNEAPRPSKFLLKVDPGPGMTELFRCVDWRRDYHTHWLSTDFRCPYDRGRPGMNAGIIGFIGTRSTHPNMKPLYHLRLGTHNAGSENTHNHYFALGDVERDNVISTYGYELVGLVGWVFASDRDLPK